MGDFLFTGVLVSLYAPIAPKPCLFIKSGYCLQDFQVYVPEQYLLWSAPSILIRSENLQSAIIMFTNYIPQYYLQESLQELGIIVKKFANVGYGYQSVRWSDFHVPPVENQGQLKFLGENHQFLPVEMADSCSSWRDIVNILPPVITNPCRVFG